MLQVTILNQDYWIKNQWSDVSIRDMKEVHEYISNLPKWLENYIYSEDDSPVSESKLLKFYIEFIGLFSNIPKEYLEGEISVNNTNELSLVELFGLVAKFLGEPSQDDISESEYITLRDTKYYLIESVKTAGGVEKLLGGATYKHFAESQALSSLFQDKKYRKWEYLARITAILFRETPGEQYEEEVIDMRTKAFENLPVSEAYKGYFFLLNHISKLQSSITTSLTEKVENLRTQSVKTSLKAHSGGLKLTRLLKKVFFPNKD